LRTGFLATVSDTEGDTVITVLAAVLFRWRTLLRRSCIQYERN